MSARDHPPVLVLGRDDRSTLAVVRSLGRKGCAVHLGWHEAASIVLRSRHLRGVHTLPAPDADGAGWIEAMTALLRSRPFRLVVPVDDPATLALAARRRDLEQLAPLALPGERALAVTFDKRATWELAHELGIPVPRQVVEVGEDDLEDLGAELGWPLVLKPRASWRFGTRKWEHVVKKAYHARELRAAWRVLAAGDEVLAQENVPGSGVGVEVLAKDGEVLLAFQHERLHEPPRGGGSSYRRSVPLDPELEGAARTLSRALELTGVAMIEFKREAVSGRWWLIEVNGRFWGSLPLALRAGADFPRALYEMHVEGRDAFDGAYRRRYARNLWRDVWWLRENRDARRGDPTLLRVGRRRRAMELGAVLTLREGIDSWAWDDPRPALAEAARVVREFVRLAARRWRRAARRVGAGGRRRGLRAALGRARSVLFVCKGNVCRSPFAEHLARRMAPTEVELRSAGYWRHGDRACPPEAVEVAASHGLDLGAHRSRVVDAEDLERAELVLVFDAENERALAELFPGQRSKVHRIGALLAGNDEVRDPWGAPYEEFAAVYDQIAAALGAAWGTAPSAGPDPGPGVS